MKQFLKWIMLLILFAFIITSCPEPNGTSNQEPNDTSHTHDWSKWSQTTAPTCTNAGVETRICSLDSSHKETRTDQNAPAIGHNFGTWIVTKEATKTIEGEETRACTRKDCVETQTNTIPVNIDSGLPPIFRTGD